MSINRKPQKRQSTEEMKRQRLGLQRQRGISPQAKAPNYEVEHRLRAEFIAQGIIKPEPPLTPEEIEKRLRTPAAIIEKA